MTLLPAMLRTSISARSAAIILAVMAVLGVGFFSAAVPIVRHRELADQQRHLGELLDTVAGTVSIACFLGDRRLAREVVTGLLSNRTVGLVVVRGLDEELARGSSANWGPDLQAQDEAAPGSLVRAVASPFDPAEIVGHIVLLPDVTEIERGVKHALAGIEVMFALQFVVTGAGIVVVVMRLVTRPIQRISERLHLLQAETGQKLDIPEGNETDEIGQLVRDVNALVDCLVSLLNGERELRVQREAEEKRFRAIFEHADSGIFLLDRSGRLVSFNPAFARLLGLHARADEDERPLLAELLPMSPELVAALVEECVAKNASPSRDLRLEKDGAPGRWISVVLSPIDHERVEGIVNDITERKRVEEHTRQLAEKDALTAVGNRLGFEAALAHLVEQCGERPEYAFAMLMLDLDWFKEVNDTYGHQAGDEVLAHVARVLERAVRKSDYVARLGGDEFAILIDAAPDAEAVEKIADKILHDLAEPVPVAGGHLARIGASIGGTVFRAGMSASELIRQADAAMYRAKAGGRNRYRLHHEEPAGARPAAQAVPGDAVT